ncbi:hypothetical protein [Robiginitalea sp. IMCC43444]|uniref:hypothetical protein n=1 Tax=Robiginitalea sp. IMCC43444 TaxID=3459121 RepID=UPI0040419D5B
MKPTSKHKGFTVPEGYFDTLTDRVLDQVKKEHIPKTSEDQGFKLPEGYFDTFGERLESRMQQPAGKVRSLWGPRMALAMSAAAAVVLMLVYYPFKGNQRLQFDDLEKNEIQAYLESDEMDMSTFELAEVFPLDGIEMDDVLEAGPEEEQILDYLDDNIEGLDEIYWETDE